MANFSSEEQFIIDESVEMQSIEAQGWIYKIFKVFPALRSRGFQLYFASQIISNIGTWLQVVAQGWLVWKLTDSPLYVGIVGAAATLPSLFFSLHGGVIVDRFSRRKILLITQSTAMLCALVLGGLTLAHLVSIWHIIVIALLLGCANAIDLPTRHSFNVDMVGKDDLPSATALTVVIINTARVIGPGIAGFMIALVGIGGSFLINGASYLAVIIALFFIKPAFTKPIEQKHSRASKAILEGLHYSWNHLLLRLLLVLIGIASIFAWQYLVILPVVAENVFHVGAAGLGYLFAAAGLGSIVASSLVSAFAKRINHLVFIVGGIFLFTVAMFAFTSVQKLPLGLIFIFFCHAGLSFTLLTALNSIQSLVKDNFRGRVLSIFNLMAIGLAPLGNFLMGFLSEHFGTSFALRLGAMIIFISAIFIFFGRQKIEALHQKYQTATQ